MRLAIIDLGTNSVRFDIHEINVNRFGHAVHRRLYREKSMVRLGQDLFLNHQLSTDSKRRTLEAIEAFRDTMDALKVDETLAFGTAAMRDASNGDDFLHEIKKKTGVEFRIIDGVEEAALIAKGILANESTPKGLFGLVDIGGGSTEISICKDKQVLFSHSFPLGAAKLQQLFLSRAREKKTDPAKELRNYIKSVILPTLLIEHWPKVPRIIGSSGSIAALSKLVHEDREAVAKPFARKDLTEWVSTIQTMTPAELLSLEGMEPKRVDLIVPGGILLDEVCKLLGAKEVRTTEYALRDGILVSALERFQKQKNKSTGFTLQEIEQRAQKWGLSPKHYQSVRAKAEWLFDRLKSTHRLKEEWKKYLSAAAILHDVGEIISPAHHEEHSAYIVKNANFIGMQPWEANLIGSLCRWHREEKILDKKNEKKIPYEKKEELRPIFLKLLSLLQMADSLDRGHKDVLKLKRCRSSRQGIEIEFSSKFACGLEMLRFDQKKALFQELFRKKVELRRK